MPDLCVGSMFRKSPEKLKTIKFAGEILPRWAQLLDLATELCPVPPETRKWFHTFANSSGVDDSRTILDHCHELKRCLGETKLDVIRQLERKPGDPQAPQVHGAWVYSLDTMIQQASALKTCSWVVEGVGAVVQDDDSSDGDISLRRVGY